MADSKNSDIVGGTLTQIRDFVRDVGTPVAVLLFVGMVYTGWLHSPLTDIAEGIKQLSAAVVQLTQQHNDIMRLISEDQKKRDDETESVKDTLQKNNDENQRRLLFQLAVLKRICRNVATNEAQRSLCDDPQQVLPSPVPGMGDYHVPGLPGISPRMNTQLSDLAHGWPLH